jgi:hypothetical protein
LKIFLIFSDAIMTHQVMKVVHLIHYIFKVSILIWLLRCNRITIYTLIFDRIQPLFNVLILFFKI